MYIRGKGFFRGRGFFRGQGSKFSQRNNFGSLGAGGGDAREKLISVRRQVDDARSVIRQHKVSKVGDLRAVLPRNSKRGRGVRDLRQNLHTSRGFKNGTQLRARPELVYANDEVSQTYYRGPVDTNVTVGRGGRVTISRQRGRSIDREREAEKVQPTGIPAHMRRQPSPPSRAARSPSPVQHRRQVPNRQRMSNSPPTPITSRPQSYITTPKDRRGGRPMNTSNRGHQDWSPASSANDMFEYRQRSRSPINREDRMSGEFQGSGNMRGFRDGFGGRLSPQYVDQRRGPPSSERWEMASAPTFGNGRGMRGGYQQGYPSPMKEQRATHSYAPRYVSQSPPPYQPTLRMDRPGTKKQVPRQEKSFYNNYNEVQMAVPEAHRRGRLEMGELSEESLPPPQQMYYCIQVTSLSKDVSEDDVVELFSDIGPLVSAKLVNKGHAQVCFVHKKDARTAIDKYDRRELDGIPMNLKLIEKSSGGSHRSKAGKFLLQSRRREKPLRSSKK